MVPGGITESIWHFSGYLRIFDDITRDRDVLDEGGYQPQADDYVAKLPNFLVPIVDDEFVPFPVHMPEPDFLDGIRGSHIGPIRHPHDHDHHPDHLHPLAPPALTPPIPADGGGGGGGGELVIQVIYQPGGEQSLLDVHQINYLSNDGILEMGTSTSAVLAAMLSAETGNTLDRLEVVSDYAIPYHWQEVPQDNMSLGTYVQAYDQHLAFENGMPEYHSVTPGYYTDGVSQDPSLTSPDQLPIPQPEPAPDITHGSGLGQWAYDGGNSSTNIAEIADLAGSTRTMIVLGNYYSTDAIIQTNAYVNFDHITVSNPDALIGDGGNHATNMADFVQNPGVYSGLPAYFAGPEWNVEVVNGNYYNVNTLVQTNYLSNNNITIQESSDTQYVEQAGGNQQENLAQITNGDFNYDLVIVGGSYNNFNAIFQNNVLVNNDIIKMSGNGTDPSQTVSAGNNQLVNMATIEHYGGNNTQPVDSDLINLINAIKGQAGQLDPSFGEMVAGDGGTFNVLYVTGNYYDINAVWQTNIMANSNVVMQLLNPPASVLQEYYGQGTETQSVTTGNNVLANEAAIYQVNPTVSNVGGQVYTDTILIQANLVTQQSDHVAVANPQALVPELIAFIGPEGSITTPTQTATPTTTPAHEDPLASLTH